MSRNKYGPWLSTSGSDGPDWKDIGKTVQVKFDDGQVMSGDLVLEDVFYAGEGNEVPLIYVEQDGGERRLVYEAEYWREILLD